MTHSVRHTARRLAAPSRGAEALVLKFVENGRSFDVAVEPQLTTNDLRLVLRLALAGAGFRPASASFKMPMICSSVNRFFIAVPLWNGLYTVTVLNAGSRSVPEHRFALGVESDDVEYGLPDIDAHAGNRRRALLAHGTPPRTETGIGPDYAITGGADHPISG